jgi:hypothetical protein
MSGYQKSNFKRRVMKSFVRYVAVSIALSAGALIAYPVKIKNATALDVTVVIELALCSDIIVTLLPGETKSVDTGGCCSKKIIASGSGPAGSFSGMTFTPPGTGLGISCRGYEITITGGSKGPMTKSFQIESGIKEW